MYFPVRGCVRTLTLYAERKELGSCLVCCFKGVRFSLWGGLIYGFRRIFHGGELIYCLHRLGFINGGPHFHV